MHGADITIEASNYDTIVAKKSLSEKRKMRIKSVGLMIKTCGVLENSNIRMGPAGIGQVNTILEECK